MPARTEPSAGYLGLIALFLGTLFVSGVAYVFAAGLLGGAPPRTALERDLGVRKAAVEADPGDLAAYASYAEALIAARQLATAEDVLEAALTGGADDPRVLLAYARLRWEQGQSEEALTALDGVMQGVMVERSEAQAALSERGIGGEAELPGTTIVVDAALMEGQIRSELSDFERAIDVLTVAIDASPATTDLLVARAQANAALGRTSEARADYETALTYVPDLESALRGLEQLGKVEQ